MFEARGKLEVRDMLEARGMLETRVLLPSLIYCAVFRPATKWSMLPRRDFLYTDKRDTRCPRW